MFIGAGPAGTAGGIKITTMFALLAIVAAVIRGRNQAVVFGKSISSEVVHQAVAVVVLGFILVVTSTISIMFLPTSTCRKPYLKCSPLLVPWVYLRE